MEASHRARTVIALAAMALVCAPQLSRAEEVIATDVPAYQSEGHTMVPLRAIMQWLGASIAYENGIIEVTAGDTQLRLKVGSRVVERGAAPAVCLTLEVPPVVVAGTTFVPVRFVAECLGHSVEWNEGRHCVLIHDERGGQERVGLVFVLMTAEPPAAPAAGALEQATPPDKSGDGRYKDHDQPVIAVQTRHGVVYAELWPDKAPQTVKAILGLVRRGFYDGIFVHRVVPGFVVQMGDPLTKGHGADAPGVGTGGPGFTIPAEFNDTKHDRGIVSMARAADVNSAGSQFFICLSREQCRNLDGKYTAFGKVLGDGMTQVDAMVRGDLLHHVWVVKDLPVAQR
jgi:cyclophilin family peptidyl-prolyl cis-trans isomerase